MAFDGRADAGNGVELVFFVQIFYLSGCAFKRIGSFLIRNYLETVFFFIFDSICGGDVVEELRDLLIRHRVSLAKHCQKCNCLVQCWSSWKSPEVTDRIPAGLQWDSIVV